MFSFTAFTNGKAFIYVYTCLNIMIEIETVTRKWGNSVGVLLGNKIKPNKKVRVIVIENKITKVKDIFGIMKFSKSAEQLEKETDKELGL